MQDGNTPGTHSQESPRHTGGGNCGWGREEVEKWERWRWDGQQGPEVQPKVQRWLHAVLPWVRCLG